MMMPLPIDNNEIQSLYYSTIGKGVRSIAITSPHIGAGVSMIAYALSRRAAAAGKKALLIDFNLMNAGIGESLALPRTEWGLKNGDSTDNALTSISDTGLSILTAPKKIAGHWEFKERDSLKEKFKIFLKEFDVIIIDTAPLLDDEVCENIPSLSVCGACEEALMVVLSGRTVESDIIESYKKLKQVGAKLSGTIINDRYSSNIADELCREISRIEDYFPSIALYLKDKVRNSVFLNQRI